MTFEEVDKIICSYGFYKYCDDTEENNTSMYMYPGIDRLAIHTENLCEQNYNSLDEKHFSEKE